MKKRVHLLVSGRVQGVWYRASTKKKADELGVLGWVRNLPDSRVEIVAEAGDEPLRLLVDWCRVGPQFANVSHLEINEVEATDEFTAFEVTR